MASIRDHASIWLSGRNSAIRAILLVAALGSAAILAGGPLSAAVGADSPPVGEDSPPVGVDSPPVRVDSVECGVWPAAGINYVVVDPSEDFAPRLAIRRNGKWVTTIDPADYTDFVIHPDEGLAQGEYSYEVRYRIDGTLFTVDCGTVQTTSALQCVVQPNLNGTKATVRIYWNSPEPRPKVQIRRDGDWQATLSAAGSPNYVDDSPGAADASFEVRHREDGERVDTPCERQEASLPHCFSFIEDGQVEVGVWWFDEDAPRVYQIRRNDRWAGTVDFDEFVSFTDDAPEPGQSTHYAIRFRLDGERYEVDCGSVEQPAG